VKRKDWQWAQGKNNHAGALGFAGGGHSCGNFILEAVTNRGPMCDPKSGFQPHGLLWHPLAGVMAVAVLLLA